MRVKASRRRTRHPSCRALDHARLSGCPSIGGLGQRPPLLPVRRPRPPARTCPGTCVVLARDARAQRLWTSCLLVLLDSVWLRPDQQLISQPDDGLILRGSAGAFLRKAQARLVPLLTGACGSWPRPQAPPHHKPRPSPALGPAPHRCRGWGGGGGGGSGAELPCPPAQGSAPTSRRPTHLLGGRTPVLTCCASRGKGRVPSPPPPVRHRCATEGNEPAMREIPVSAVASKEVGATEGDRQGGA